MKEVGRKYKIEITLSVIILMAEIMDLLLIVNIVSMKHLKS